MIEIKLIGEENKRDVNIPNQPFDLFGKMIPSYSDGRWDFTTQRSGSVTQMCFPDENYNYDEMSGDSVFIGAYDGDRCIGLAIMQKAMFRYMYLCDLKVNRQYRGFGIAKKLIDAAKTVAVDNGYQGIYTIGQDNNLAACLFYIKSGFRIGGFDTEVYKGTKIEGTKDIIFYLDC